MVRAPERYTIDTLPVASAASVSRYFCPDQPPGMYLLSFCRYSSVLTIAVLFS